MSRAHADAKMLISMMSILCERNHGAGDHPIPFRTRQLSPASPKVLWRKAMGDQDVPLTQDAYFVFRRLRTAADLI